MVDNTFFRQAGSSCLGTANQLYMLHSCIYADHRENFVRAMQDIEGAQIDSIFLVIPEDVPAGFAAIYGFTPRLIKGNDHRFGFGFSFGNHADFQILYEFGPQGLTKPLQPPKIRSTAYRRVVKRPLVDLLLRIGVLKKASYKTNVVYDDDSFCDDEPR